MAGGQARSRTLVASSDERYAVIVNGRRRSVWESRNEARLVAERAVAGRPGMTAKVVDRRTGRVIERHDTRGGGQARTREAYRHAGLTIVVRQIGASSWGWNVELAGGAVWTHGVADSKAAAKHDAERAAEKAQRDGQRTTYGRPRAKAPGTRAQRWAEVHAAAAAGHPIRHPREYVFGK